ncbi:hypothetical protein ILYODFUR_008857 [Ilyodon furcidens]|uniref:Transmembrane protein n=1 Tax=Ilyodon furcidens TaxID=33524 RepID=A0ABV0UQK5_9TELE
MLAQTQSMVRDGKWRGRENGRARVGEKEGGKKKLHSGLPVVVHSLPTFTRSSCFCFFFLLFFFSSVRTPLVQLFSLSVTPLQIRIQPITRAVLPTIFFIFHRNIFFLHIFANKEECFDF